MFQKGEISRVPVRKEKYQKEEVTRDIVCFKGVEKVEKQKSKEGFESCVIYATLSTSQAHLISPTSVV